MGLNILIVGAGIGGPALASFLIRSRQGHNITVVERSLDMRLAGAQVDVKCQAVPIIKRMGLLDAIKEASVQETGLEVVDSYDKVLMSLGVSPADKRTFTLTSEIEIMRGDLVQILYSDSLEQASTSAGESDSNGKLRYRFGTKMTDLSQQDQSVHVTYSDGTSEDFDLVVGADGQRSETRTLAFGSQHSEEAFESLGIHAAYFTIPRIEGEEGLAKVCVEPGKLLLTRTSNRSVTGANIFTTLNSEQLRASYRQSLPEQKKAWSEITQHSIWQSERLEYGMQASDDFYAHEQGQVKMPQLSSGRVVLLGDAGYSPSPFTGLGTTLALGGAYTLAGELVRHGGDVSSALGAYEVKMKPLIEECQQLSPGGPKVFFPGSRLGVWILQNLIWTMSVFRVDKMMSMAMAANGGTASAWREEDYSELNGDPREV